MSNAIKQRPLKAIPPPRLSDIVNGEATTGLTLVNCYQCGETMVVKKGRYLQLNLVTEQLEDHTHQPGELCWRAYEDEQTGEPLNKRSIQHRIAAIRRREAARGK